jgi:hypothetical protein
LVKVVEEEFTVVETDELNHIWHCSWRQTQQTTTRVRL